MMGACGLTRSILDEEGRCILGDLWPRECACRYHRGKTGHRATDRLDLTTSKRSAFQGPCALDSTHLIEEGDTIHFARDDDGDPIGWICVSDAAAARKYWDDLT